MRNPLDSWAKSDTFYIEETDHPFWYEAKIGQKDKELSEKLQEAGTEHHKHLRMIMAYADITASLFWWKQFDCYRAGVEKISCSTMHTLMRRPLTPDDFEHDCINDEYLKYVLDSINTSMEAWRYETDPDEKKIIWRSVIEALPQSFLQTRTVMISYAALRNIVRQRKGHKLKEWAEFIDWCRTLPENWMIFDEE